jgi:hypothetical protein
LDWLFCHSLLLLQDRRNKALVNLLMPALYTVTSSRPAASPRVLSCRQNGSTLELDLQQLLLLLLLLLLCWWRIKSRLQLAGQPWPGWQCATATLTNEVCSVHCLNILPGLPACQTRK